MDAIDQVRSKAGFIIDMDDVIYHGNRLIPGVTKFIRWLEAQRKKYLFLTNSSERSSRELQQKLERLGIGVGEEHFYTSALVTAEADLKRFAYRPDLILKTIAEITGKN